MPAMATRLLFLSLALLLPAVALSATFGPTAFTDPTQGQYLDHASRASSVFVLVSDGLVSEGVRGVSVARWDSGGGAFLWRRRFKVVSDPFEQAAFISVDGDKVHLWLKEGTELFLTELDACTGATLAPAVASGVTLESGFGEGGVGNVSGGMRLFGGKAVVFQQWYGEAETGAGRGARLLPSGFVIEGVENFDDGWIEYIGDGKFAFLSYNPNFTIRIADAVNGRVEPVAYQLSDRMLIYPALSITSSGGFIYLAYDLDAAMGSDEDVWPLPIYVVKLAAATLERQWIKEIPYDIPVMPAPQGLKALENARFDVSTADGVVGVSFSYRTIGGQVTVDGVDVPSPDSVAEVEGTEVTYDVENVLVAMADADGATLAVTTSETAGPESTQRGGSMLDENVYAMVGLLDVTQFSNPDDDFLHQVPTGRMAAFFPLLLAGDETPNGSEVPNGNSTNSDAGGPDKEPAPSSAPLYQPVYDPEYHPSNAADKADGGCN